jgi:hypothetical protein
LYYTPEGCSKEDSLLIYKIHGNWNSKIKLSKYVHDDNNVAYVDESTEETIFVKKPY